MYNGGSRSIKSDKEVSVHGLGTYTDHVSPTSFYEQLTLRCSRKENPKIFSDPIFRPCKKERGEEGPKSTSTVD